MFRPDEFVEFGGWHHLRIVDDGGQILREQGEGGVDPTFPTKMLGSVFVYAADDHIVQAPFGGDRIVAHEVAFHGAERALSFKVFVGEVIARHPARVVIFKDHVARSDLPMQILKAFLALVLDVAPFEIQPRFVGLGDDEMAEVKTDPSDQCGAEEVGVEESIEAHSACKHGDQLGACRHFGCEKDRGDEHDHGAEQIAVEDQEIHVVVHNNLPQAGSFADEVFDLFGDVEDHGDHQDQGDGYEKGPEEFDENVSIENLEPHSLRLTFSTITAFHAAKSPASMCARACSISHK